MQCVSKNTSIFISTYSKETSPSNHYFFRFKEKGRGDARKWVVVVVKKEDEGQNYKDTESCKNIRKALMCSGNFHLGRGTSY